MRIQLGFMTDSEGKWVFLRFKKSDDDENLQELHDWIENGMEEHNFGFFRNINNELALFHLSKKKGKTNA